MQVMLNTQISTKISRCSQLNKIHKKILIRKLQKNTQLLDITLNYHPTKGIYKIPNITMSFMLHTKLTMLCFLKNQELFFVCATFDPLILSIL